MAKKIIPRRKIIQMKILFFAIGNQQVASSRVRVYQYLPYLRQAGIKCRVITYIPPWQAEKVINLKKESLFIKLSAKLYSCLKIIIFMILAPRYDALFIQKVLLPVKIQRLILLLNKNIMFDFDDALNQHGRKFLPRFDFILSTSSMAVVLENDYAKSYVQRFNSKILLITGPIDIQRYRPGEKRQRDGRVVLGWIGSPSTSYYLKSLYEVFQMLSKRHRNLVVELIGSSAQPELKGVNIVLKKWSLETETLDLQDFDIGLMPLYDDQWSRGKGGYKLLQYMALGIPCVASPVGINKKIIKDGVNGFLADSQEQWIERLTPLIENPELRDKMGREGRKMAEEFYSYEVASSRLLNALKA